MGAGPNFEDNTALDLSVENDLSDDEHPDNENTESDVETHVGSQQVVFSGFCRALLDSALRTGSNSSTEGVLPYKASALSGLSALLKSVVPDKNSKDYAETIEHQRFIYNIMAPSLFSFVAGDESSNGKPVPPLLISKGLECLSSSLVTHMPSKVLNKTEVTTTVLLCSTQTLKDKKFWKVRLSGLDLLLSLVSRVGDQNMSKADDEKQLIMEAILPYKERIIDLARKSLSDSESQVTATASKMTLTMAWWP